MSTQNEEGQFQSSFCEVSPVCSPRVLEPVPNFKVDYNSSSSDKKPERTVGSKVGESPPKADKVG
jgi:hypothetical protein